MSIQCSDELCSDCVLGVTYSDTNDASPCKPVTNCSAINKVTAKNATLTSDATCEKETKSESKLSTLAIVGIVAAVFVSIGAFAFARQRRRRLAQEKGGGAQFTGADNAANVLLRPRTSGDFRPGALVV